MILPRRLMTLADGRFCEEHDPKQAMNYRPKGFIIPDVEAERIGLKAYLDQVGWGEVLGVSTPTEEKAVAQGETEDKAVAEPMETKSNVPEEDLGPGLHVDRAARSRRGG